MQQLKWCGPPGGFQIARLPSGNVALRSQESSKVLIYTDQEWRCFLAGVKLGEFDDLI